MCDDLSKSNNHFFCAIASLRPVSVRCAALKADRVRKSKRDEDDTVPEIQIAHPHGVFGSLYHAHYDRLVTETGEARRRNGQRGWRLSVRSPPGRRDPGLGEAPRQVGGRSRLA